MLWEDENWDTIVDTKTEQWQEETEVYHLMMKLPADWKTALILRFYEDMELSEIATVTALNLSQVKYRLYTGLEKLREYMQK